MRGCAAAPAAPLHHPHLLPPTSHGALSERATGRGAGAALVLADHRGGLAAHGCGPGCASATPARAPPTWERTTASLLPRDAGRAGVALWAPAAGRSGPFQPSCLLGVATGPGAGSRGAGPTGAAAVSPEPVRRGRAPFAVLVSDGAGSRNATASPGGRIDPAPGRGDASPTGSCPTAGGRGRGSVGTCPRPGVRGLCSGGVVRARRRPWARVGSGVRAAAARPGSRRADGGPCRPPLPLG